MTAGNYAYVSCDRGIVIVSIADPMKPQIVSEVPLRGAGHIAIQFRYAFACDAEGLKVIDITDVKKPVVKTAVSIAEARDVYVARTYAYVAAGKQGLAIVDVERPEQPSAPRYFDAGGALNDAWAVKVGMTNASLFAYVADGKNGLRVLQLTAPNRTEGLWGFSPPPEPELIATFKTRGERFHCALRDWIATGLWMRAATSLPSLAAAVRAPCPWRLWNDSICICPSATCTP